MDILFPSKLHTLANIKFRLLVLLTWEQKIIDNRKRKQYFICFVDSMSRGICFVITLFMDALIQNFQIWNFCWVCVQPFEIKSICKPKKYKVRPLSSITMKLIVWRLPKVASSHTSPAGGMEVDVSAPSIVQGACLWAWLHNNIRQPITAEECLAHSFLYSPFS